LAQFKSVKLRLKQHTLCILQIGPICKLASALAVDCHTSLCFHGTPKDMNTLCMKQPVECTAPSPDPPPLACSRRIIFNALANCLLCALPSHCQHGNPTTTLAADAGMMTADDATLRGTTSA